MGWGRESGGRPEVVRVKWEDGAAREGVKITGLWVLTLGLQSHLLARGVIFFTTSLIAACKSLGLFLYPTQTSIQKYVTN